MPTILRKYHLDPSHDLDWSDLEIDEQILDHKEQILCTKTIPLVKVIWQHGDVEEVT